MSTGTEYESSIVDSRVLDEIVYNISAHGFGSRPALTTAELYKWIAEEIAKLFNDPRPDLAHIKPQNKHTRRFCENDEPMDDRINKSLHKYMNWWCYHGQVYWYCRNTKLRSVELWMCDNFHGSNPSC